MSYWSRYRRRRFTVLDLHLIWKSAIFLLPVCLTRWPRKYTTGADSHVDSTKFEVDRNLIRPSTTEGYCCCYAMWPCDVDLLTVNTEQLSYTAGHVTNPATKFEDLRLIRSWVTVAIGYHCKCVYGHCACAESRDQKVKGQIQLHFCGIPDLDLSIHYITFIVLRRLLRVVNSWAVQC